MSRCAPALLVVALALLTACAPTDPKGREAAVEDRTAAAPAAAATPGFVGAGVCGQCHQDEHRDWQGSHHDLAMQDASPASVLGDFDQARFEYAGITSVFHRRDGRYFVTTDGADGKLADFEIRYAFGVQPLQQYLIALPGGRLQALGIAWDSRPASRGGQRWFHLYPGQSVTAGHPLHWTGRNQNWNFMCAECHSTGLDKGYDAHSDSYRTRWAEMDVACEACHGAGQAHVEWAHRDDRDADARRGFGVTFHERKDVHWRPMPQAGHAQRSEPRRTRLEIDRCGRCHGRANLLGDTVHGASLLDSHRPALLDPDMYWPDGQMRGEVFTWGSFLQSRMQAAGVTCSDCHQPHSLQLRASGNALCAQCHTPQRYDDASHSHHAAGSAGSRCIACHMPVTTFMQVDDRHDHAFRIPRPDLSLGLGVPNACNSCHDDRTAEWAASTLRAWFPGPPDRRRDFAPALHAAVAGTAGLRGEVSRVIADAGQPAIVRASAVRALIAWLTPDTLPQVLDALRDSDPLVRMAAAEAMAQVTPALQASRLAGLLKDPVRAVRIEAAASLAGAGERLLGAEQRADFGKALDEYIASLHFNADRPDVLVNLGNLQRRRGDTQAAAAAYRRALDLDAGFVAASINLADLERARGDEDSARAILRAGLERTPDAAELHHALGLAQVRQGRREEAEVLLEKAAELDPDTARYSHVLAVALHDWGRPDQAREVLTQSLQRHPRDRELLTTLAIYQLQAGDLRAARSLVTRLLELDPDSASVRELAAHLGMQLQG